jgi:hypothetical protein
MTFGKSSDKKEIQKLLDECLSTKESFRKSLKKLISKTEEMGKEKEMKLSPIDSEQKGKLKASV